MHLTYYNYSVCPSGQTAAHNSFFLLQNKKARKTFKSEIWKESFQGV